MSISWSRYRQRNSFYPGSGQGKGHSPKSHGSGQAQAPTTDLETGEDIGATFSLPSIKVTDQGNEEVGCRSAPSEHPSPTTSLLAAGLFAAP